MIERHEGRIQVVCDTCPASHPATYEEPDFRLMIAEAKADGWSVRKVQPKASDSDTTDLFRSAPRLAKKTLADQPYLHACPACSLGAPATGSLL